MKFVVQRACIAIPVIVAILCLNFFLTRLAPGDPLIAIVGEFPVPEEYINSLREKMGLDRSIPVQLLLYLKNVLMGDLGFSFVANQSVASLLAERFVNTIILVFPSLILAAVGGIILGYLCVRLNSKPVTDIVTALSLFGYSIPIFWLGQLFVIVFAIKLELLPVQGMRSTRGVDNEFLNFLRHWLMPGICVTLVNIAIVARVAKTSFAETMEEPFNDLARAKGISENAVFLRHIFPNALVPIISVIGLNFGTMLTCAIMVETVFAWPGLGNLFMSSIASRDFPVLQGIFILTGITVVVANLLTDIASSIIDPRIRFE
jgi:ABC-type dipeptide/oligopeptide/nickel transport system permease component